MIGVHAVTLTPVAGGAAEDISCLVDRVTLRLGRDDTDSQPEANAATVEMSLDTDDDLMPAGLDVGAVLAVFTTVQIPTPEPPVLRATNLVPNPSFETGTAGWGAQRGTLSRPTDGGVAGAARLRYTADGTTGGNYVQSSTATGSRIPVTAGVQYTGTVYAGNLAVARGWRVNFLFYDAGNVQFTILSGPTITVPAGAGFTRVTHAFTAPANAVSCVMRILSSTSPLPANEAVEFDAIALTEGSAAVTYFDGDTPDTERYAYAWTGTPHASSSTKHETPVILVPETFTRFRGKVTDIDQAWTDAGIDTPNRETVQVIATGPLADLGRRIVGDTPWPQQLDGARVAEVMEAAGAPLDPLYSDPGTVQILPRDVDSQPALDVAHATATDAGGVLWSTRDGEIRYADAEHRRGTPPALYLDACDILVTPRWRRNSAGLVNKVSIGYGVAPEGSEQPRYVAERADSIATYGRYELTATTTLAALADASSMGQMLLTRNREPVWIMDSLPVDVAGLDPARYSALLGMEIHSLIDLTGLPYAGTAPTSAQLWLEGWTETLEWGRHEFLMSVSGYCRTVPPPQWDDISPEHTWDSTNITWDDMSCVGPQPSQGRWNDVPASTRWNTAPGTWDEWTG